MPLIPGVPSMHAHLQVLTNAAKGMTPSFISQIWPSKKKKKKSMYWSVCFMLKAENLYACVVRLDSVTDIV